jgi:uncharacterized protein DUF5658
VTSHESGPYDPLIHGDRRRRPTPMVSRYTFFGGRRKSGEPDSYTDLYALPVFATMLAVTTLNVLDSFFTLVYLQRGGSEANPVASWMLEQGNQFFIFFKTFVMGGALAILCLHKNFQRARVGIWLGSSVYVALTAYHLFLFFRKDMAQIL